MAGFVTFFSDLRPYLQLDDVEVRSGAKFHITGAVIDVSKNNPSNAIFVNSDNTKLFLKDCLIVGGSISIENGGFGSPEVYAWNVAAESQTSGITPKVGSITVDSELADWG